MGRHTVFVSVKSKKAPLHQGYPTKAEARDAHAEFVADMLAHGIAILKGGRVSVSKQDFLHATVRRTGS